MLLEQNRGSLMDRVFTGLKKCLQSAEDDEETITQTNQLLYDMQPDIQKSPDLLNAVQGLIPQLIENLGNSKVSSFRVV